MLSLSLSLSPCPYTLANANLPTKPHRRHRKYIYIYCTIAQGFSARGRRIQKCTNSRTELIAIDMAYMEVRSVPTLIVPDPFCPPRVSEKSARVTDTAACWHNLDRIVKSRISRDSNKTWNKDRKVRGGECTCTEKRGGSIDIMILVTVRAYTILTLGHMRTSLIHGI